MDVAAPLADHRQLLPERDERIVGKAHARVGRSERLSGKVQFGHDRVGDRTRLLDLGR